MVLNGFNGLTTGFRIPCARKTRDLRVSLGRIRVKIEIVPATESGFKRCPACLGPRTASSGDEAYQRRAGIWRSMGCCAALFQPEPQPSPVPTPSPRFFRIRGLVLVPGFLHLVVMLWPVRLLVFAAAALFAGVAPNSSARTGSAALTFCCSARNDLYLALGRARCPRFADPLAAIESAAPGSAVLLLADNYPAQPTMLDPRGFDLAQQKQLRLFLEAGTGND